MAANFMEMLGALTRSGLAPSSEGRMRNVLDLFSGKESAGLQEMFSGLLGRGQSFMNRAEQAVGGRENLAAAGVGALLGALSGRSSAPLKGLGGGLMGLLGMMAFKALKNAGQNPQPPVGLIENPTPGQAQQLENDAHLVLTAMLDAAKADGKIDADELNRITGRMKEVGIDQDGMNYVLSQLQSPMSTEAIVAAVRDRPELAAQVYSASLMAVEVDTLAERTYLERLAQSMGLTPEVVGNIEQLVGMQSA